MSAEASRELSKNGGKSKPAPAAIREPKAEAKAPAAEAKAPAEAPAPQVESQEDRFETVLTYEPDAKLPATVVLVWACALIGLGAYTVGLLLPDLALWGAP